MWAILSSLFYSIFIFSLWHSGYRIGLQPAVTVYQSILQLVCLFGAIGLWIWAFDERTNPPILTKW